MDIPDYVNVSSIYWPDGTSFGSRILDETKAGELYFTKGYWTYYCRLDPNNTHRAIITCKLPTTKLFLDKQKPITRKEESI